jgi:hypothetical protein
MKITVSVDMITRDGQNLRITVFKDVMLCSLVDKHYLHGVISQEIKITITTIIRTSNLTEIVQIMTTINIMFYFQSFKKSCANA